MEIKQLWCVGFKQGEQLELAFRVYDAILNNEKYNIDFCIPVNKEDYKVLSHPDILIMNNIQEIKFDMIAKTEGTWIIKRLDEDIDFINMVSPIIKAKLLNNEIHINFVLDEHAMKILI